jgi:hypothetical protein
MLPNIKYDVAPRYNKEVVSVGILLNFCCIHDSFFPLFVFIFLIEDGILRRHMSVGMFVLFSWYSNLFDLRNATKSLKTNVVPQQ